ncbi:protein CROWDED NUCLEI 1 [Dendrobium catenatum]|uniref:protein CROWDED NUCLEI 1 n=1 Tax=Dendrobium catenatum TaxID=906689 RepID=UPI0009F63D0C|nr:protein CROWDED NUCLEI 1 [Dendrobium catenatum]
MFAGEQEGNGFPAVGDPARRVLTGESSSIRGCGGSGEDEEVRFFDSEGFPDGFGRAEKNALVGRIAELEKELHDYQYHMGLLLMEKKMRTSEFEELRKELSEARENLKLERAAFSSTLSENKKQELSIQIALETEKKHVSDLERTIYKILAVEKYLHDQRETLQSWEPSLQEHELEPKGSQNFLDERMMDITYEKEEFSEIQEEVEENPNSFVLKNNASNYREAFISERHQNLASKKKDAASKQEKLEKKERDLLTTQVKLPTRDNALQSEKLVFDHELEGKRKSLDFELQDKLNKLGMQNDVKGKDESQTIEDRLAHKMEVETDEVKIQKDRETLNTFYNRLQKFKQELMKKRDLLLSLSEQCKACMNCSIIFSDIDLGSLETFEGAELADDANEKSKLNSLNADKLGGSAEQQEVLCHATSTFEIDSYDRKMQTINEGSRKRQRAFDIEFNFPGQKRYNFRPSTILKVLISKMQSEHLFGTASDEKGIYYEPSSSD